MLRKYPREGFSSRRYEVERGFELPLPMTVEGQDARGQTFKEETVLAYMSHKGASFPLNTPVTIDTRLRLVIVLPERLAEGQNLRMVIHGRTILVEPSPEPGQPPRVSLQLDSRYIIKPDEEESTGGRTG
jgi:hypothetical protein